MSDLLEKLKHSGSTVHAVKLDGVSFGLRILNEQDYLDAGFAVEALMKKKGLEFGASNAELFEDEKTCQLLARALVDPETGTRIAATASELRQALTREQREYLTQEYLAFEKQSAPSERTMDDEAFALLYENVKKKPEQIYLSDLSIDMLKKLIVSLAGQPSG